MTEYIFDLRHFPVSSSNYFNSSPNVLLKASEKYSQESPKGEFVLIVEGKPQEEKEEITPEDALSIAQRLVEGGLSKNEAAKETAKQTGLKKSDIYKLLQNGD